MVQRMLQNKDAQPTVQSESNIMEGAVLRQDHNPGMSEVSETGLVKICFPGGYLQRAR